jgi:hypothetical protein
LYIAQALEALQSNLFFVGGVMNEALPRNVDPGKTPPANRKVFQNLPIVKVTTDDLLEETNKECLICLDEQKIGFLACKLPCGHLYHKACIVPWLQKHCTCKCA